MATREQGPSGGEGEEPPSGSIPGGEPRAQGGSPAEDKRDERREFERGESGEFEFHTGANRATDLPDAIEFVGVHKSFGSNHVLQGLNMGLPEGQISMILGPSGTGKSVCIKHIVGLLYPDEGDVIVQGQLDPQPARRRPVRDPQEVRRPLPGRSPVRLDEPVRQHRLPPASAHREERRGDRRDRPSTHA